MARDVYKTASGLVRERRYGPEDAPDPSAIGEPGAFPFTRGLHASGYRARGTYIYPPEPSLRLVTDVFSYCAENVPRWNTISVSGYHIREAGATAPQEIAFTFANALAYVAAARAAGQDVARLLERISF